MDRTMFATQQAHVAGAARPCVGSGRGWRLVGNGMPANALMNGIAINEFAAFMKSTAAATKRTARHLGTAST
jgi:hypothetical protein